MIILSKLVENGIFFEQSLEKAKKLLKFIKDNSKSVYLYEYVSELFLIRKYKNMTDQN